MALKKILETGNTRRYFNTGETVAQTITVTGTTLTNKIDVTLGDTTTTVQEWTIQFSDLSSIPKYNSNVLIGFKFDINNKEKYDVYNMSLRTFPGRDKNNRAGRNRPSLDSNIQILVKNTTSSFADADILVYVDNTYTFVANVDVLEITESETLNIIGNTIDIISHLDNITVVRDDTYANPDYDKYTISTETYVDQISLEPLVGILDKSRVYLSNGKGSVRVLKSSLDTGETAKFKVGFVNYPGLVTVG